jgi:hypothetical protein
VPKKLDTRPLVRSMNWSTIVKLPGGRASTSDPTDDTASTSVTPSRFSASILARALIASGLIRCPRPCRGRNDTATAPIRPLKMASDGAPHGVVTSTQRPSSTPSTS